MTEARVIADSTYRGGVRLTTMEVRFHRFVLAEFNTHRVFSRNSASSRAIPVGRQLERIDTDLAWPVSWPREVAGMQGGGPLGATATGLAKVHWRNAANRAAGAARTIVTDTGLHKSVVNRLLEPFMWHTVIVTSTAWDNFFALRTDADAQPEIRVAAEAMLAAYGESRPRTLSRGDWHVPYLTGDDADLSLDEQLRVSAARCARVSYLTHDGRRDPAKDLELYDRLISDRVRAGLPVHWSPLEHVATPWSENRQEMPVSFEPRRGRRSVQVPTDHLPRVGNLLGWRSLRTTVEAELGARTFS